MDIARKLLETGDSPIENIRRQVGYRDPTAFRRAFKEQTGIAPSEYRDRYGWAANAGARP